MSFELHGHFFNFNSPQELIPPEESMAPEQSTTQSAQSTPTIPPSSSSTIPPPPTDQVFGTSEQAVEFLRNFAKAHGFSVAKRRSKKDNETQSISAIYLSCDRGRVYQSQGNQDQTKRRRTSMRIDCPFDVVIRYSKERMQYFVVNRNPSHNHEPAAPVTARPTRNRQDRKDKVEAIKAEMYLGTPVQHLSPRSRRLNVGVVGIGRMGQRHALNTLHLVPRANLMCVCSTSQSDLDWANKLLRPNGVQVYSTFEEMIQVPGLEAVIISSATAWHAKHTLDSLDRGIHVLCEKPVTLDLDELSTIIRKTESKPETKMMVGFTRRFDDDYMHARKKVITGEIGTPIVIRSQGCEMLDKSGLFIQYAKDSGGIFVDIAIHDIDLTLSFFGDEAQPKALWATGTAVVHKELEEFHDVDNAVGVVEFWGGKIAHYYHSRTAVHGYDNVTEVFGTKGKLAVNPVARKNRVEVSDIHGVRSEALPSWMERYSDAFVTEVRQFTAAILDNTEMPLKLSSSLTSLRIALALQESLVTGQKIEFDEQGNRITPPLTAST